MEPHERNACCKTFAPLSLKDFRVETFVDDKRGNMVPAENLNPTLNRYDGKNSQKSFLVEAKIVTKCAINREKPRDRVLLRTQNFRIAILHMGVVLF